MRAADRIVAQVTFEFKAQSVRQRVADRCNTSHSEARTNTPVDGSPRRIDEMFVL